MENNKCPKCGCNAVPMLSAIGWPIKPCGLVREGMWVMDMSIAGCPMSEWQDGYLEALKTKDTEKDSRK